MEISVKQMMAIENKGHDMGFLKKFMMENAGAAAVKKRENSSICRLGNNLQDVARHLAGYGAKPCNLAWRYEKMLKIKWNWDLLEKMPVLDFIRYANQNISEDQNCLTEFVDLQYPHALLILIFAQESAFVCNW